MGWGWCGAARRGGVASSLRSVVDRRKNPENEPLTPVSPLAARFFGVYTFMASLVRAYAAYNITNRQ